MPLEPRIRVSAVLRWEGRVLLCRHEKAGRGDYWLLRVTSTDAAVRGHRLFDPGELDDVVLHPPIQRFLGRWQPGDPAVYLGALWAP
jgi:hypothetical protein